MLPEAPAILQALQELHVDKVKYDRKHGKDVWKKGESGDNTPNRRKSTHRKLAVSNISGDHDLRSMPGTRYASSLMDANSSSDSDNSMSD